MKDDFLEFVHHLQLAIGKEDAERKVPWSWIAKQLVDLLLAYPTGLTLAVVTGSLSCQWQNTKLDSTSHFDSISSLVTRLSTREIKKSTGVLEVKIMQITSLSRDSQMMIWKLKDVHYPDSDLVLDHIVHSYWIDQRLSVGSVIRLTDCKISGKHASFRATTSLQNLYLLPTRWIVLIVNVAPSDSIKATIIAKSMDNNLFQFQLKNESNQMAVLSTSEPFLFSLVMEQETVLLQEWQEQMNWTCNSFLAIFRQESDPVNISTTSNVMDYNSHENRIQFRPLQANISMQRINVTLYGIVEMVSSNLPLALETGEKCSRRVLRVSDPMDESAVLDVTCWYQMADRVASLLPGQRVLIQGLSQWQGHWNLDDKESAIHNISLLLCWMPLRQSQQFDYLMDFIQAPVHAIGWFHGLIAAYEKGRTFVIHIPCYKEWSGGACHDCQVDVHDSRTCLKSVQSVRVALDDGTALVWAQVRLNVSLLAVGEMISCCLTRINGQEQIRLDAMQSTWQMSGSLLKHKISN